MTKYLLCLIAYVSTISCNHNAEVRDKYSKELPDSILINEVINAVILQDSLNLKESVNKVIFQEDLYIPVNWDTKLSPPPPPPPNSISSDLLHRKFNSKNNPNHFDDSVFFRLQTDTTRKFVLNTQLFSKFNKDANCCFRFYVPLFSFSKQYALVRYWHCDLSRNDVILKRKGNTWLKIESVISGMR